MKISKENFICVQGWMVEQLHLKNNELLIYAIIYGFSQAENQVYDGSLQYLADWTGATKQGVIKNLKSLLDKGMIAKNEKMLNGVKFVEYYTTKLNGALNKVEWGIKQSLPNNIENNIENNKENNTCVLKEKRPTLEEVKEYCKERNNDVDPNRWYNYYSANGWKVGKNPMKDWKAAVRTWERKETKEESETSFNLNEFFERSKNR